MNERDELTEIYVTTLNRGHGRFDRPEQGKQAADAILAAGYRRPRTITTVEELDALPEGTVIRDASGVVRDRFNESETGAALWLRPGAKGWMLSRNFADKHFPATVLHVGGAE